jgi:hypothetical protein
VTRIVTSTYKRPPRGKRAKARPGAAAQGTGSAAYVVEMDTTSVACRGEALREIWWRGRQWAVTSYGIECLDGT